MVDDPSLETFPAGVSVLVNSPTQYTMTMTGFEPESGVSVTGEVVLTQIQESPLTLTVSANLTATATMSITVVMSATATWAAGENPPDDPPASMTGTFVYNGTTYQMSNIMEALEDLDDDDIGPDDAPPFDDNVLGTADGIFSLIGLMMEDPADYPSGVSVTGDDVNKVMELRGFEPEPGIYVSGSISVTVTATSPFAMSVTVSITMSGEFDATVAMTANASWETGDPGYDPPSAINGTLTFNGTGYSVAELLAALE